MGEIGLPFGYKGVEDAAAGANNLTIKLPTPPEGKKYYLYLVEIFNESNADLLGMYISEGLEPSGHANACGLKTRTAVLQNDALVWHGRVQIMSNMYVTGYSVHSVANDGLRFKIYWGEE